MTSLKKGKKKIIQCKMHHQQRITLPSRREVIDVTQKKRDENHKQKQNIYIEENSAFEFEAKIYIS